MSVSQLCIECKTMSGKVHCTGCDSHFCVKHFQRHRSTLNNQMDQIVGECDSIKDQMDRTGFDTSTTEALLAEIAECEREIMAKVKEAADRARAEVNELSNAYEERIRQDFERFSISLHEIKESENYAEPDLVKLQHTVDQFQREVNKLSTFATVVMDKNLCNEIEWNALIGVEDLNRTNDAEKPSVGPRERVEPVMSDVQQKYNDQRESAQANNEPSKDVEKSRRSKRVEVGITDRISHSISATIPSENDRNAGTICCHNNQLMYADYDKTLEKARVIFLHDIKQPNARLTIDWIPVVASWKSATNQECIRDIIYCDRLKSYLLLTQSCIYQWNGDEEEFGEYYRTDDCQLKQMAGDTNFIYLVGTSNRFRTQQDMIILLNYERKETIKAFTDIMSNRYCNGSSMNYEIMDIAVAPHSLVMMTYRNESLMESGLFLFAINNRHQEWIFLKQLKLDVDWNVSINFTPRVEWANKLSTFMLVEFNSGHLVLVNDEGEVKGECKFQNTDDNSESPINISISDNDWLCTRYNSTIVVKKIN